jgi:preprotein translocase subunit YajC
MNPGYSNLLLLALMLVAFYFLLIRPQRKRVEAQRQMQSSIMPGDEILTSGGLVAHVVRLDDDIVTVELSRGVEAKLNRRFIVGKTEPAVLADGDTDDGEIERP